MKTISFQVSDEIAEELTKRSVYLDVFGVVRWTENYETVKFPGGSTVFWRAS